MPMAWRDVGGYGFWRTLLQQESYKKSPITRVL